MRPEFISDIDAQKTIVDNALNVPQDAALICEAFLFVLDAMRLVRDPTFSFSRRSRT